MKTLTVIGWRRPEYLRATLMGLRRCVGVENYKVWVLVDHGCIETLQAAVEEAMEDWCIVAAERRLGCNGSTLRALELGFASGDYHIHLEDDCLPARDMLLWFEWASRFGDDSGVFTVSAYSRERGRIDACGRRAWFTGWGWATWRDRWEQMAFAWPGDDRNPWDVEMNNKARRFRYEVHPIVARVQNIGRDDGFNVHPEQWMREQYNPAWAGESVVSEYVEV